MDECVGISLTPELIIVCQAVHQTLNETDKKCINFEENYVTINGLKIIREYLCRDGNSDSNCVLQPLLKRSRLVYPYRKSRSNVNTTKSKEFIERHNYLLKRQEERQYNAMIGDISNKDLGSINSVDSGKDGNLYSSVKNNFTISANMIISMISCYGIGYYVGTTISTKASTRMVCGLVGAIGIMMVEMTIFIIRAIKMESAYERNSKNSINKTSHIQKSEPITYPSTVSADNDFSAISSDEETSDDKKTKKTK